jgi:hypothetical protein
VREALAMISIDEAEIMLNEIAEEIPKECYKDLNGGILLLSDLNSLFDQPRVPEATR